MESFYHLNNILYVESVAIDKIVQNLETPFYCYSYNNIVDNYLLLEKSFVRIKPLICFAVKANSNLAVLSIIASLGGGVDAVSKGEIIRAFKSGIASNKISFSGVGKTYEELKFALENDILQFNIESESELLLLNQVALELDKQAYIALRVNPDIDGMTHHKISTGKKDNKFGIYWTEIENIARQSKDLKYINLVGISTHIGSQIVEIEPFARTFQLITQLVNDLNNQGHNIKRLDLGGGIGISYLENDKLFALQEYASLAEKCALDTGCDLILEPGRLIVGNSGILVTKITYIKETKWRNFLIVDAGMNDLMRPSLYDAVHQIVPVHIKETKSYHNKFDIVGPVCETSDVFLEDSTFNQKMDVGDLLAIKTTGAYGAVMASTYNSRLLIPEVMVRNNKWRIIRRRPTYDDMLGLEL
ncbi:MAG: diaminopimelate decarboxylase [Rickettsiales endosymbiont of Dermacentor nuttalli]